MGLIVKRRKKEEKDTKAFRLEVGLIADLDAYAEFTNVPASEIVEACVRYAIDSDKEFAESKQTVSEHTPRVRAPKVQAAGS